MKVYLWRIEDITPTAIRKAWLIYDVEGFTARARTKDRVIERYKTMRRRKIRHIVRFKGIAQPAEVAMAMQEILSKECGAPKGV